LIGTISELFQLDIDTVYAYDHVLDEIDDGIIRARLNEFRDAHRDHSKRLSEEITALGGTPPKNTRDIKGYAIEAFTALRGFTGMKGALKALKTVEEITNRQYGEIVSQDVPAPLKEVFRKYFSEEKMHLNYIDSNLEALR
jgi:hypothetical protein